MPKTVVIGLGNPILSDDRIGIEVARALKRSLEKSDDIDVMELYAGGIRLMEAMEGYERAVIVDAMTTGIVAPGTVVDLPREALASARNAASVHDMDLLTAMEMGRAIGLKLPEKIKIIGIEAKDVDTFGEALSEDITGSVDNAVRMAEESIAGFRGEGR